jgi:UDP-N-acetylmuramoyl-tripeptide--D-alanyl-D-alanine ligase
LKFTLDDILRAVAGRMLDRGIPPDHLSARVVEDVTIDSRRAGTTSLFVPIVADRDGHDFISDAVSRGAIAYLTSGRSVSEGEAAAIEVADTSAALADLGRAARARVGDFVVGITGSVGKTTVKELARGALAPLGTVAASPASYNNELGVPLTLLNAPDRPDAVVIEMGARGVGHIASLCDIASPTVAIVTEVAGAHLELFGTLDEIARAKSEIVATLPRNGLAVLNGDNPRVRRMRAVTEAEIAEFGMEPHVDVTAEDIDVDHELRASFTLRSPWGSGRVRLGVRGAHQIRNALAAAIPALWHGIPSDDVVGGLGAVEPPDGRMDVLRSVNGAIVIDDAYNANPTSMRAALTSLAHLRADRKIAVVGLMAELGDTAADGHRDISRLAEELGVELIAVGTDLYGSAPSSIDGVFEALRDIDASTAVLVKGSRVAALERVVEALTGRHSVE